jgi:hypothetical protein
VSEAALDEAVESDSDPAAGGVSSNSADITFCSDIDILFRYRYFTSISIFYFDTNILFRYRYLISLAKFYFDTDISFRYRYYFDEYNFLFLKARMYINNASGQYLCKVLGLRYLGSK